MCLIDADRNLCAIQELLDHDFRALQHGLTDGGGQLILVLDLADTERGTVGGGFHEAGHADALLYLVVADQLLVALTDEQ